jgi:hypothetical protein
MTSTNTGLCARGFLLFALRALIGWQFLYEGLAKLWTPGWTAVGVLSVSRWWFADLPCQARINVEGFARP